MLLEESDREAHYPSLPQLLNALAQRFLDTDCTDFRRYLALMLEYLYNDCPEVSAGIFMAALPQDIRQFHIDWLEGSL